MSSQIDDHVTITGNLTVAGSFNANVRRETLVVEVGQVLHVANLIEARVWDAFQTPLGTAGSDDLGITAGTWGTGVPYIVSEDLDGGPAATQRCRLLIPIPHEYVAGETLTIRVKAGMVTSVASVSATVDVEAYKHGGSTLVSGTDLVTTSATSVNSTTFTTASFTLTTTNLSPGDVLDVRLTLALNSVTASAHFGAIAEIALVGSSRA